MLRSVTRPYDVTGARGDQCSKRVVVVVHVDAVSRGRSRAVSAQKAAANQGHFSRRDGGVWWPPAVDDVISRRHAHPDDSKALAVRIAGEVSVKVLRYALVACSIGHTVPMVMQAIGLPCP